MGVVEPVARQTLLAHEPFLRSLARSLVFDPHRVDDLVQETWLAALRHSPRPGPGLRAWLAQVLRNAARQLARRERRRACRERAAARPERAVPPQEGVRERVVDAVLALDEPFRTAVLLRFFEGLPPREVARRTGVPVETARTRLRRALARLRQRLGETTDDAGSVALLPLLVSSRRARTGALATVGVVAMKLKFALVACLVLATAGFGIWRAAGRAERHAVARAGARPAGTPASPPAPETVEQAGDAATPGNAATGKTGNATVVPMRVRLITDAPRHGVAVIEARTTRNGDTVRGEARPGGEADIDIAPLLAEESDRVEILADHPAYLPARAIVPLAAGEGAPKPAAEGVEIPLVLAGIVTGLVLDQDGSPLERAHVATFALRNGQPMRDFTERRATDASGRYRLRVGADGRYLVAAVAEGFRPGLVECDLRVGGETAAAPIVLSLGLEIRGHVTINGVSPDRKVTVHAQREEIAGHFLQLGHLAWHEGTAYRVSLTAGVEADGSYCIAGLDAGIYEVRCFSVEDAHNDVADVGTVLATAPASGIDFDVPLSDLLLVVRRSDGPAAGTNVGITADGTEIVVTTDAAGRARCGVRPGGSCRLRIWPRGGYLGIERTVAGPPAGGTREETLALEPVPERATLLVRLVSPENGVEPPAEAAFAFWRPEQERDEWPAFFRSGRVRGDGKIAVTSVPEGTYRMAVRPGGPWHGGTSQFQQVERTVVVPAAGELPLEIVVPLGGRLSVLVRSASGENASADATLLDSRGDQVRVQFYRRYLDGAVLSPSTIGPGLTEAEHALPPGDYRLRVRRTGFADVERDVRIEAGVTASVEIVLVPR